MIIIAFNAILVLIVVIIIVANCIAVRSFIVIAIVFDMLDLIPAVPAADVLCLSCVVSVVVAFVLTAITVEVCTTIVAVVLVTRGVCRSAGLKSVARSTPLTSIWVAKLIQELSRRPKVAAEADAVHEASEE